MPRRLPAAVRGLIVTVIVGGVAVGACLAALIPGAVTLAESQTFESPALGKLRDLAQRSTIYNGAGGVMAVLGTENREDVKLTEVPAVLQNAVIAVEDQSFWKNNGVDLNAVFRAFMKNLTSGEIEQGGSTISQQLIKNRILSNKRDINRKVREIILAIRLNDKYSKKKILEQYLNTVYFGQGSYGVKAAVERFFLLPTPFGNVPANDLAHVTVAQAALLAGLISSPESNNPFVSPENARAKRSDALKAMVKQGYITQEQADAANAEPIPAIKPEAELRPKDSWSEEIQDRLFADPDKMFQVLGDTKKERQNAVLTGGLKIYATLDPKLQKDAQNAMDQILPEKPGWTGSLVSMDPKTGEVKAMVAGPGFQNSQYNIATSYPGRQAGSTWKIITVVTAMESGFSPKDIVNGASPCDLGPRWGRTVNAEGGGGGPMTFRAATAGSVNCAFVRTQLGAGTERVMDTAHKLGITQKTLKPILTLTLGTIESTAVEMATVAATIANSGIHHDPTFVSKIVGPDGSVLFDAKDRPGKRAVSAEATACAMDMLRGVVTGGTGTAANLSGHTNWGKTGTTDNKADANFVGGTPQLVAFIWHGNATARIPGAGFGGQIPARIFKAYMDPALSGQPNVGLPDPGPYCARPAAFITENGRVATFNGLLPGQTTVPTQAPPTVATVPVTVLPPTTTTTKPKPCTVPPEVSCP
jgi:membrane peptidoglycan carboxypeptidase